jgi:hypothetical protein
LLSHRRHHGYDDDGRSSIEKGKWWILVVMGDHSHSFISSFTDAIIRRAVGNATRNDEGKKKWKQFLRWGDRAVGGAPSGDSS